MLRAFVIGLGVVVLLGATVLAVGIQEAWPAAIQLGILGLLILAGTLLERRYRSRKSAAGPQWQPTVEKFVDPTTGKLTEVRYNAATGERAYVDDGQP
jgi:hypothetical protein